MRILKRVLVAGAAMLALVGAVVLFSFWDASQNRGWEFGYFEEYNRMRHLLLELPGVMIVNERHTHDVVLEEFEFALLVNGKPVTLFFGESDSVRIMPRDVARETLRSWLAQRLADPRPARVDLSAP